MTDDGLRETYTLPWGAVCEDGERMICAADTRDEAIEDALETALSEVECGWSEPGPVEVTVYREPVFCAEAPEDRCQCGGDHAGGDPLLGWAEKSRLTKRIFFDERDDIWFEELE